MSAHIRLDFQIWLHSITNPAFIHDLHLITIHKSVVSNARYHSHLSLDGKVILSLSKHENTSIFIDVLDSGSGIPKDKHEIIFEPFATFDNSNGDFSAGIGLGLAISREFARALGGDLILIESKVGLGSVFRLTLPIINNLEESGGTQDIFIKKESQSMVWS